MYSVSFMYQFNKYVAPFAEQYHPVTAGIIAVNILPEILYVYLYGGM